MDQLFNWHFFVLNRQRWADFHGGSTIFAIKGVKLIMLFPRWGSDKFCLYRLPWCIAILHLAIVIKLLGAQSEMGNLISLTILMMKYRHFCWQFIPNNTSFKKCVCDPTLWYNDPASGKQSSKLVWRRYIAFISNHSTNQQPLGKPQKKFLRWWPGH